MEEEGFLEVVDGGLGIEERASSSAANNWSSMASSQSSNKMSWNKFGVRSPPLSAIVDGGGCFFRDASHSPLSSLFSFHSFQHDSSINLSVEKLELGRVRLISLSFIHVCTFFFTFLTIF